MEVMGIGKSMRAAISPDMVLARPSNGFTLIDLVRWAVEVV